MLSVPMPNTAPPQLSRFSVPRRLLQPPEATTLRSVRQDNPAPDPAPPATPQPAPLQKETRTAPIERDTNTTQQKKIQIGKDVQLNLWVRPVVKAELERVAKREGLSISAAGEAFLEKALQQNIYTQHGSLLETILDKAVGRHMRLYSDRNAGLQARNIQKTEMVFQIATNILARMPGMDEKQMERILNDADDAARSSIKRQTVKDKQTVEMEKAQFEKGEREA